MDDDLYINGPRDYDEQTDSFRIDLDNLVYRYIDEYDICLLYTSPSPRD